MSKNSIETKFRWNNDDTKYLDLMTTEIFIEILMQEAIEDSENKTVNSPVDYSPNFTAIVITENNFSKNKNIVEIRVNLSYEFTGKRTKEQNNLVCRFTTPDGVVHEHRMTIEAVKRAMEIRNGNLNKLMSGYPSNYKQGSHALQNTVKLFLMDSFK